MMSASRAAFWYCSLTLLLWALIPSLLFPNPPLDVVEGFAWGREMALGYTKHPPMQAWLLELSYHLTGGHAFGAYWLSSLSVAVGYLCIWQLAHRLGLDDWKAFWALVMTSVTFYFTLPLPEFNPNILQIPVWAAMILLFHRALEKGRLLDWILLGAVAAFGLYTKYFVALLIGAIGLYALVFSDARRSLATPGPWIAGLVCGVLFLPHVLWLVDTNFVTLEYAGSRSRGPEGLMDHLWNPVNFFLAQIANHAGLFIIAALLLGLSGVRGLLAGKAAADGTSSPCPDDRFLLWFAFLPLAVILLMSAVTGNEFKHMWGTPLFVLSGILAVRFLLPSGKVTLERPALIGAVLIQTIFLGVIVGQALLEPLWKTKQSRIHYPGQESAELLTTIWREEMKTPLRFVAGDMWTAAHVTLFSEDRPTMYLDHDAAASPWVDQADLRENGVLLVWRGESDTPPAPMSNLYPKAKRQGSLVLPYTLAAKMPPAIVNWTIIRPYEVVVSTPRQP
ncbi:glycosyltransferase family 39 protein [Roseibium sediminis]|uniref:glycosyltransferase family 39 protein n=1 Tax=Roseibium sediminis TaxID=1775174 RepID=UPI00123D22F7|nr:glycosyltransferase family 39 protein [Roseibium sediminis]